MKPEIGPAKIVLPSLVEPTFRGRFQMLLAKASPFDQMPLVDLEGTIEAGVEDRRQRDHTLGKGILFVGKGRADPNDDLGRTKIEAARRYFDLQIAEE